MAQIEVDHLSKQYQVIKKKKGFRGTLHSLIKPEKVMVEAVDDISFDIQKGEVVGYIGPNGAGKSTTIKMMIGILNPTSGSVHINGISPHEHRKEVVRNLGVVFGQRTQLYWDLRLGESFELLKRMYDVDKKAYEHTVAELTEVLQLQDFIDTPVRQLSLGQKMRGELAAAMIHSPSILFLDEPTIGLDLDAKQAMREFIANINRQRNVTVLLTTHDLSDVSELCKRLIVINKGRVVEDGDLGGIVQRMSPYRVITLELRSPVTEIRCPKVTLDKVEGTKIWCRFDHHQYSASEIISELARETEIADLSVLDADIEDTVRLIYHKDCE
ncbi:MAG TPA: ATP-binding cassette domain-containing protein [Candidatus Limiplasma sp.]|nr:ATP-binding cassette domain-containing protein [Candidatus Limiplasma sp.]